MLTLLFLSVQAFNSLLFLYPAQPRLPPNPHLHPQNCEQAAQELEFPAGCGCGLQGQAGMRCFIIPFNQTQTESVFWGKLSKINPHLIRVMFSFHINTA